MHISWKWFTDKFVGTPPDSDLDNVEENSGRYSLGFGAQNIGDQIVSAKTVLPWFLTSVGGPAWVISFLVPVRESGSMLPQAFLRPWLQHFHRRLPFMLVGAAGQAGHGHGHAKCAAGQQLGRQVSACRPPCLRRCGSESTA